MDLAIRVNVRYAAPPNSQIKDALRLFKSPRWVQSIIRYIMPQLNSVSPAAVAVVEQLKTNLVSAPPCDASCVVCMEPMDEPCVELACSHHFHVQCIEPWLRMHSTCPTCRAQLPTDACSNYSVYAINTTIILQQSQARMATAELLELSASNQIIRAVVNARVRRNTPTADAALSSSSQQGEVSEVPTMSISLPLIQSGMNSVMSASAIHRTLDVPGCITEPVVPILPRHSARRRLRDEEPEPTPHKRSRLSDAAEEQDISTTV